MKKLSIFFIMLYLPLSSFSQTPDIEWQNTIGSNGDDFLVTVHQTEDGGYILGGYSYGGISGDKTEAGLGFADYWIVKLNTFGAIEWQNTIGGNSNDILTQLEVTSDGGYILGGYSDSGISGDKTEASLVSSNDYWVVKIDDFGNIQWQNTIGGAGNDELRGIDQTTDGGYILGGRSNSPISGDKTEASDEYYDYWVVKIDILGNLVWENTIGGNEYDYLYSVCATIDNGCLIGGMSNSPISGDKTDDAYTGSGDYWILKIDSLGNIIWQNAIGGNGTDWLMSIHYANSGGFILGGYSSSNISGDKTENNRGEYPLTNDYWVVIIDSGGIVLEEKTIGGSYDDRLKCLQPVDSGFIIGGYSFSGISGDKTEPNIGFEDYWSLKLDSINSIGWQKTSGGWLDDLLTGIAVTLDNGYILGGYSSSPISGDKTEESIGANDYWVIKLQGDCTNYSFYADDDSDGYGATSDSVLACTPPDGFVLNKLDCDDSNAAIHPDAAEICNSIDNNCNGETDEGLPLFTLYADIDDDIFGDALSDSTSCMAILIGYVEDSTDCDDGNNLIHEPMQYFADMDSDSFGDAGNTVFSCTLISPSGYVTDSSDCDDTNATIYPGAEEVLNNFDDNCNGSIDEGVVLIENIIHFNFEIFPNPNDGNFQLILNNPSSEKVIVKIYNSLGEEIYFAQPYAVNNLNIRLPQSFIGIGIVNVSIGNNYINKLISVFK